MAKRKGWSDLSPGYRGRLQRGGIDRAGYERGATLSGARGHGRTPEHPLPANRAVPKRFERWYNERFKSPIKMLATNGEVFLVSVSQHQRSLIGSHWNAVHSALWNIPMPKAWWWATSPESLLAQFGRFNIKGTTFTPGRPLGTPQTFHFMTNFNDVQSWTYEDTASFNNIYELVA